jgi:hypothetical protein
MNPSTGSGSGSTLTTSDASSSTFSRLEREIFKRRRQQQLLRDELAERV